MHSQTNSLQYDGAPREITRAEAEKIASLEYCVRRAYGYSGDHYRFIGYSGGADGGMHFRQGFYGLEQAQAWLSECRESMVARIMAGECQHTIWYRAYSDTFYCA